MKSTKTSHIFPILSFLLLIDFLLYLGPVHSDILSNGATIIESIVIYEADERVLRPWWVFSFQNKVYKFEEFKYVDEITKNKGMKPINTNKAKEAFIND